MEEPRYISDLLERIAQPGFLVKNQKIVNVNQAARAMLLAPEMPVAQFLCTGSEEYAAFQEGHLCLTLTIGGQNHAAVVSRLDDCDLFLLDPAEETAEFRSMALVSKELRMPLMQIISSAQQLANTEGADSPAAARMNQGLMQMLRLVNNLGDISRYMTSSRMEVRDVDSFLQEVFEKAGTLTRGRVQLSYEGLKQPVFSQIDPEQLERAVWNILSNSIKFLPENGSIQGRLSRHGRMLHLTLQDSGSGIAEAVRETLFARYLRKPGLEDPRYGLGLGLTIVQTAAANHGGTVLISSIPEGTRVTMTMAICQDSNALLRSPLLRPDYTGGWDHGLVELSDCLSADLYSDL